MAIRHWAAAIAVAALFGAGPAHAAGPAERPDMLPDGVVAHGARDIAAVWLTGPTERYRHGALGDAIEASGLAVDMTDGRRLGFTLGPDSVFEDRVPRLYDLDGDGTDEILVVRSRQDRGAALAVLAVRDGTVRIVAETPPIGQPNRWLNPVGAADFDGDGRVEIALVRTPHIGGTLLLYRWRDGGLAEAYRAEGFSNHVLGTRELGLSAIVDADGDGVADLAVPSADRRSLRIVGFAGGRLRELAVFALPAPVADAITVEGSGLTVGLSGGRSHRVALPIAP